MAQLLWDIMWGKETVIKELCQRKATLNVYFSSPDYRRKIKYYKWGNLTKWIYYLCLTPKEPVFLKGTLSHLCEIASRNNTRGKYIAKVSYLNYINNWMVRNTISASVGSSVSVSNCKTEAMRRIWQRL